ncbi:hypothetical protein LCGC14_1515140 [marine sediment metagenome]|uniref:Uncharacterized protein n=1 Tax=marine sediment metagenome TaxID=412755 RepID=A0A0F9LFU7_9ZZZZ
MKDNKNNDSTNKMGEEKMKELKVFKDGSKKVEIEGIELGINQRGIVIFMSNWLKLNDFITRKIITRMSVKGTIGDAHLILNKLL